jgi:hypothetical protein
MQNNFETFYFIFEKNKKLEILKVYNLLMQIFNIIFYISHIIASN